MKKYILKLLLFSLPLIIICLPSLWVLYLAGELDGERDYVVILNDKQLIGLAYTDIREAYKFKMTDSIFRPDAIALGSSRIMQVKSDFISKKFSFYNAGGAVNNVYQYQLFLKKLHYTPKMLIISIDQFFFNPNYQNQEETFNKDSYEFPEHNLPNMFNTFFSDFYEGKIDFIKILKNEKRHIGLNAIINENGYMKDGTHHVGDLSKNPQFNDYNFKDTFERIEQGNRRFEYCEHADSSSAEIINRFLDECEKREITVIAIIPPFAPAVIKKMTNMGNYSYMQEVFRILEPFFINHKHCYLFDYTDLTLMGVHNYDFLDGFHGSEVIYNIIIRDIISSTPSLRQYFKDENELIRIEEEYKEKKIRYHSL